MEAKAASVLLLLLHCAALLSTPSVASRLDFTSLVSGGARVGNEGNIEECCKNCICFRPGPPTCVCTDVVGETCSASCNRCICAPSSPPTCRCLDIKPSCGDFCPAFSY